MPLSNVLGQWATVHRQAQKEAILEWQFVKYFQMQTTFEWTVVENWVSNSGLKESPKEWNNSRSSKNMQGVLVLLIIILLNYNWKSALCNLQKLQYVISRTKSYRDKMVNCCL